MNPTDVFPLLIDLFERWKRLLVGRDGPLPDAVGALGSALTRTRSYLVAMQADGRNRNVELQLSMLWRRASESLSEEHLQLARMAARKMEYWLDPDQWTEQEIAAAGIGIDKVIAHYTELQDQLSS